MPINVDFELLQCCAVVVANANAMRKEAIQRSDLTQEYAMVGRVDGIYLLAAMLGLGVQTVHDLAMAEEARVKLAVQQATYSEWKEVA